MQPISYRDCQEKINGLLTTLTPLQRSIGSTAPEVYIAKGQPFFTIGYAEKQNYRVTGGEVIILRNGWPIDLVECGEELDMMLRPNTTAMALSDCTLVATASVANGNW